MWIISNHIRAMRPIAHLYSRQLLIDVLPAGYPRSSDLASSISPYDAKVAAWLRFVDLPYTKKFGAPQKAPKGQVSLQACSS